MPFEVFELHPVEHNQFITFEGDAGDDDEIAFELVAGGEDVLAGHQSGHNDVGAEVDVLDGGGVKARAEMSVQAFEQAAEDGREAQYSTTSSADGNSPASPLRLPALRSPC